MVEKSGEASATATPPQRPFNDYKHDIEKIIDEVIQKKFASDLNPDQRWKDYEAREAQRWSSEASEEIIKKAQDVSKGFKFNCTVIVF